MILYNWAKNSWVTIIQKNVNIAESSKMIIHSQIKYRVKNFTSLISLYKVVICYTPSSGFIKYNKYKYTLYANF